MWEEARTFVLEIPAFRELDRFFTSKLWSVVCEQSIWNTTVSKVSLLPWSVGDIHLPSFRSPKNTKYFMSPVGHVMAHRWQYKYHITDTSIVKIGATIYSQNLYHFCEKWNNFWQKWYYFFSKLVPLFQELAPHFQKLVPLFQKLYHFLKTCTKWYKWFGKVVRVFLAKWYKCFGKVVQVFWQSGTSLLKNGTTFVESCSTFHRSGTSFENSCPIWTKLIPVIWYLYCHQWAMTWPTGDMKFFAFLGERKDGRCICHLWAMVAYSFACTAAAEVESTCSPQCHF